MSEFGGLWKTHKYRIIVHDGFCGLQANLFNPFIDGRAIYIIVCEESESGVQFLRSQLTSLYRGLQFLRSHPVLSKPVYFKTDRLRFSA